jgi:hypothetical protein
MKRIIIILIAITTIFCGCKKYEEGPCISFRSAYNRIYGEHKLIKYTVDGADSLNQLFDSLGPYFVFKYSRAANVRTCSIGGTRNDGRQSYFVWEWELSDSKKFIRTTVTYDAYDYGVGIFRQKIKPDWKILKLKANDMILTTTYFSKEYLIELTANK